MASRRALLLTAGLLSGLLSFGCGGETQMPTDASHPADVTIQAYLAYFGDDRSADELDSLAAFLNSAFDSATAGLVHLQITIGGTGAFPPEDATHDYATTQAEYPWLQPGDIPRIWYYDHPDQLVRDVGDLLRTLAFKASDYDMIAVLSEAPFAVGIGYYEPRAFDRPAIMIPSYEIGGWVRSTYVSRPLSVYTIVDESIHETGHFMGLGHSCTTCISSGILDLECCTQCPHRADVMSYCRHRPILPTDTFYNLFAPCNQDYIEHQFIPRFAQARRGAVNFVSACS